MLWPGLFSDVKKMPLGKLSKAQIAKGFEVLEDLEKAVDARNNAQIVSLSSKFYTVIPHDFGRKVPPVMNTLETIREKYDMLLVRINFLLSFTCVFLLSFSSRYEYL